MAASKKHIEVGDTRVYQAELIYSRVIGLQCSRDINMKDILEYELAPIPTSMFSENGQMRISKSKAVLKKKLQVEHSCRTSMKADAVFIDGCAALWVMHWPSSGTVLDFASNFLHYITNLMQDSDVYLVFDRYSKPSIKDQTRLSRAGGLQNVKQHVLSLSTPLPPQKTVLDVTENKVQLIEILSRFLIDNHSKLPTVHKLVLTSSNPNPVEVYNGVVIHRADLHTTHEEADVIIVNQVVSAAQLGATSLKVIAEDTDVFVLLVHFYVEQGLTCGLVMESPISGRALVDIRASAAKNIDISTQVLRAHALTGCILYHSFLALVRALSWRSWTLVANSMS